MDTNARFQTGKNVATTARCCWFCCCHHALCRESTLFYKELTDSFQTLYHVSGNTNVTITKCRHFLPSSGTSPWPYRVIDFTLSPRACHRPAGWPWPSTMETGGRVIEVPVSLGWGTRPLSLMCAPMVQLEGGVQHFWKMMVQWG